MRESTGKYSSFLLPTELLRCFAESTLVDMVQLLFSRLPSLSEKAHSVDDTSPMDQVSSMTIYIINLIKEDPSVMDIVSPLTNFVSI
jgi:hypothetical protein